MATATLYTCATGAAGIATRGIHRMVDEEKHCIDILTQVSALDKALESVVLGLLDDHLKHGVMDAVAEGDSAAGAKSKEAADAIARLVRS